MSYTRVHEAADITEEIIAMARDIYDGWFDHTDARLDWGSFLDRLDGSELADGSRIDLSEDLTAPAIVKIKKDILAYRKL